MLAEVEKMRHIDLHLKNWTEVDGGKKDVHCYKMLVMLEEWFETVLKEDNT